MTVSQLIERLEDLPEDMEVRIGYQPNYPLYANVAGTWEDKSGDYNNCFYLLASGGGGYFTGDAWEDADSCW